MDVSLNMYSIPGEESASLIWCSGLSKLGSHLPGVHLEQMCGLPLVTHHAQQMRVVAVPKYGVSWCKGHRLCSVLVVHNKSDISVVSDLKHCKVAVNSICSVSGNLLLGLTLGRPIYSTVIPIYTGSHMASLKMIMTGQAEAASIDCVTYALAQRHNPHLTANTKIVAISPSFPAPPYVVSKDIAEENFKEIQKVLKKALLDPKLIEARHKLGIEGFEFSNNKINMKVYEEEIRNAFAKLDISNEDYEQNEDDKKRLIETSNLATEIINNSFGDKMEINSVLPDGRKMRVILTGKRTCFRDSKGRHVNIVGFFGTQLRLHETCFRNLQTISKIWKADDFMVENFDPMVVDAYICCEKEAGGDWYNLVVLREGAKVEELVCNNLVHSEAVKELAPNYYSGVRIHRGVLELRGQQAGAKSLTFTRTLKCQYKGGALINREIKFWDDDTPEADTHITENISEFTMKEHNSKHCAITEWISPHLLKLEL